jgi:alkylation response protein AidB-like acyl-CoA dehydrogenase
MSAAEVADVIEGAADPAMAILRLLAAAEACGGLAACTEMATAYASTREQFGRVIGSFQSVKHHLANMLIDSDLAVAVTWDASRANGTDCVPVATMAAGLALPAYRRIALQNIQIHGGVGYTWEHDAHLYVCRATVLLNLFGDARALNEKTSDEHSAGYRRRNRIELPLIADEYRRAAEEFRSRIAEADTGAARTQWARSGYLQPHWREPFGRGADSVEQLVIEEVLAGIDKPSLGLGEWVIPALLQHGSDEQIERLIWPTLEGEVRWCQLFSERGAGSDAAAVSTRAHRTEGGWLVFGQKVWTSDAMACQRGLETVRTDVDALKHKGITTPLDRAYPASVIESSGNSSDAGTRCVPFRNGRKPPSRAPSGHQWTNGPQRRSAR